MEVEQADAFCEVKVDGLTLAIGTAATVGAARYTSDREAG